MSLAVGQAPAGGAAVPLHSNLSHTVDPKKGGAEWSGRGGEVGWEPAGRAGEEVLTQPTSKHY